jgi:hypothetical protein
MEPFDNYTPASPPKARKILVPYDAWVGVVDTVKAFRNLRVVGGRFFMTGKSAVLEISDGKDPKKDDTQKQNPVQPIEADPSSASSASSSTPATTQNVTIAGMIETPIAKDYTLDLCVARALTLLSMKVKCTAGGCTVAIGGQSVAASTTLATITFVTPIVFAPGSAMNLSVSAVTSGTTDLSFAIEATEAE